MDWNGWIGKKVFLRTKSGKVYSGVINSIDTSSNPLIFLYLTDKFGNNVMIVHSEILEIKEEK